MDATFCVKYLTEPEINYELRIRGVRASRKTLQSKRLILQNLIDKSKVDVLTLKDPDFEINSEKTAIEALILELDTLVIDFSASIEDTSYLTIITRLNSLTNRVQRFVVPDEPEEEFISFSEFKDDANASCLEIQANLDLKIIPVKLENSISVSQPTENKSIPVYKWGIQFDGKSSLKAFLERVEESVL